MQDLETYNEQTYVRMMYIVKDAHDLITKMYENNLYEITWLDTDYKKFQDALNEYLPAVEYLKKFFNSVNWEDKEVERKFSKYLNEVLYEDAKIFNLVRVRHEAYPIYKQFRKAIIAELNKAMGFVKGGGKKNYIDAFDYFNDKCNKVPLFKPKKGIIKNGKVISDYENTLIDWFYRNKFYKNIVDDLNSSKVTDNHYDIDEVNEIFKQYVKCRWAAFSIFNMLTSSDINNGYERWHNVLKQYCSCRLNAPALQKLYNAADCDNEFMEVNNAFQKLDNDSWRQHGIYEDFNFDTIDNKDINESYVDDMIADYNNYQQAKRSKKEIKSIKCDAHNSNICKVVTDGKYVYAGTTFYPEDIVEICPTKRIDKASLYSQDMRDVVLEVVPNTEWVLPFGYCQYYDIQEFGKEANCTFLWDPIKRVVVIKAINKIPKHCKLILKNS